MKSLLIILLILLSSLLACFVIARKKLFRIRQRKKSRKTRQTVTPAIRYKSINDEEFINNINQFIKDNISSPLLGVESVAEHMNISKTTLFNKMKNITGTSTSKYIRNIRIETALKLLSETNKGIGQVSIETGFSDSHYFNKVFKQATGITPTQYKTSLHD